MSINRIIACIYLGFCVFLVLLLKTGIWAGTVEDEYVVLRERMVQEQILKRGITNERILNAFRKVKRHVFLPATLSQAAYQDQMILLEEGVSLPPPFTTAIMTLVIAPDMHKKVLEIGTGTGYNTAIMAELALEVYTIERKEKLAQKSRNLLQNLGYRNIKFKTGDGYLGWQEYAPFDGIIVTCAPDRIPPPLIDQLALGGKMVIPMEYAHQVQEMILLEKDRKGKIKKTNLIPVQIVPLIRGTDGH